MGVPELHAKHALHRTGNNNADLAVSWYFENMTDPTLNEPLLVADTGAAAPSGVDQGVPRETIEMLMGIGGFTEKKVLKALKNCDNNPDRAMEWMFSHMDDPDSADEEEKKGPEVEEAGPNPFLASDSTVFDLHSTVTHIGGSIHAGHYVAHVKMDGRWVYFNDDKVAETKNPPLGRGYLYVLKQK